VAARGGPSQRPFSARAVVRESRPPSPRQARPHSAIAGTNRACRLREEARKAERGTRWIEQSGPTNSEANGGANAEPGLTLEELDGEIVRSPRDHSKLEQRARLHVRQRSWSNAMRDFSAAAFVMTAVAEEEERAAILAAPPGHAVQMWQDVLLHSRNGRACPQQQKVAATEAPTPAAGASTAAVAPAAAAEAGTGGVAAELAEACSPRRQRLTPHAVRLHLRVAQHEQPPPETESEPEPAELTHRPAPQVGLALRSAILSARFAGRLHAASKREQLRATRSLESFKKTTIDMINLMRAASAAPGERSAKDVALLSEVLRESVGPLKAFSKEGIAVIVQAAVFTVADMDDLLIREGERLGSIWYVLQGMVARQQSRAEPAESSPSSTGGDRTLETVRPGMVFGSLPLMRPPDALPPSHYAARALERSLLLRIDEADVLRAMAAQERAQRSSGLLLQPLSSLHARAHFLASLRLAHSLSWEQCLTLAHLLQPRTYARNQPIVKQGDAQSGLFIVHSGRCRSYRDLDLSPRRGAGADTRRSARVEADTLAPRDMFGHVAVTPASLAPCACAWHSHLAPPRRCSP